MTNPIISKNERGIHIAHINVRSLWPKIDSFRLLLDNSSLSVCGLSETWLHMNFPSELIHVDGYSFSRLDRSWNEIHQSTPKKGGGIGIYVKNSMTWSDSKYSHLNCSTKDVECQWIILSNQHQKDIVIANV